MLLGQARGKVGSLVFARQDGKQIVRSHAEVIKNPQTKAQMIQRIFLNTIAQAYSHMSVITDHSFEGIAKGQKSMSFFMQKNLKALRERVANEINNGAFEYEVFSFSPIGTSIFVPNNYLVSKGTLPAINVLDNNADATMKINLSANTYAAFINDYSLQRGDQITFLAMTGNSADTATLSFCRVILDPKNNDGTDAPLTSALITNGAINLPSSRNEGSFTTIAFADSALSFGFGSTYMMAAAVIVSRKDENGEWKRSTAYMKLNGSSAELTYDLEYCLNLLDNGGIGTLSNRYLNNAGTATIASDSSSARNFTISVAVATGGGGTVSGGGTYLENTTARLTATPAEGKAFVKWQEVGSTTAYSTSNPLNITVTANLSLEAVFNDAMPN